MIGFVVAAARKPHVRAAATGHSQARAPGASNPNKLPSLEFSPITLRFVEQRPRKRLQHGGDGSAHRSFCTLSVGHDGTEGVPERCECSQQHLISSWENAQVPQKRVDDAMEQLVNAELIFRRGTPPEAEYKKLVGYFQADTGTINQLLRDLAVRYLDDRKLHVSKIAWLAFTHAFKRWTGKTPSQMRATDFVQGG